MSFDIHAGGGAHFRYESKNNPDEGFFTVADIVAAVGSVSYPSKGGVAYGVADYGLPGIDGTTRDAIQSYAKLGFLHALATAVGRLATFRYASAGSIRVVAYRSGFRNNSSEYGHYRFFPGTRPGLEFIQEITPALDATGLNHYGTLRALAVILNQFYAALDDERDKPVLLIEIFN